MSQKRGFGELAWAAVLAVLVSVSVLAAGASAQQILTSGPAVSPNGCADYLCTVQSDCTGLGLGCNACGTKDDRCGIVK